MAVSLEPGTNELPLEVTIPEANLWWPAGMGQPFLYTLTVALHDDQGGIIIIIIITIILIIILIVIIITIIINRWR
jgi:hypothetical protein